MYKIFKITSNPTVDFAAEELKKYLRMMMTECGEITIEYAPDACDGFRLGLMQDLGLDVSEAEDTYLDDIVHIDTDKNGGIIAGSNPRSVLLATYRYLQENGCRWLFPGIDGEQIPIKDIEAVKYHKMADCRYRGQCNEGAEYQPDMIEAIDFTPKIGLNIFMQEDIIPGYYYSYYNHKYNPAREPEPINADTILQWRVQCEAEIAKRGLEYHAMGHGWNVYPFGMYADKDDYVPEDMREYLAEVNGKRGIFPGKPNPFNTNICMSNPKARRIMIDYIVDYAEVNTNIDYLHIWLADCWNNHCECDECKKKTPSDWYVILMNELDEALEERGLDTRIVFICYVDTSWPPVVESIKNPKRFSLLVAPISRDYTVAAKPDVSDVTYPGYKRNGNELFPDVNQYIKAGREWQDKCKVRALLYEYHFYVNQFHDPGTLSFARVVYDDIINYKKNGLNGLINDCSQRAFFPNGFAFYIYGQLQFDTSLTFEELMEDYFSHAYGEDWREVVRIFERIGKAMPHKYHARKMSADLKIGKAYNPSVADGLRSVPAIRAEAEPFVTAHKNMPLRSQTVMYKLLRYYLEYCEGIAKCFCLKCFGAGEEAKEAFEAFLADFGRYEAEIGTCFDQYMMALAFSGSFYKMENKIHKENDAAAH